MLPPPQLHPTWQTILEEEWSKSYMRDLVEFLSTERKNFQVFPDSKDVFNAFNYTPFNEVQVVIVGQDPYHGPGQAHGLSFSVPPPIPPPPSLKNIYKELHDDLDIPVRKDGCLEPWAKQGVMLLNSVLTVRAHQPHSHAGKGWEQFTDRVISKLAQREDPVIFVLWGKAAQNKCAHILQETTKRHFVLTASHPSPYSAHSGFFGCCHFSKINELLKRQGKEPIEWAR